LDRVRPEKIFHSTLGGAHLSSIFVYGGSVLLCAPLRFHSCIALVCFASLYGLSSALIPQIAKKRLAALERKALKLASGLSSAEACNVFLSTRSLQLAVVSVINLSMEV
jgi:hypothetical protein